MCFDTRAGIARARVAEYSGRAARCCQNGFWAVIFGLTRTLPAGARKPQLNLNTSVGTYRIPSEELKRDYLELDYCQGSGSGAGGV